MCLGAFLTIQESCHYNVGTNNDEIHRSREENRQLRAAQRDLSSQTGRNADNYDRNRESPDITAELSRALEEIRRVQARLDGFMRTYASRSNCQYQQSVPPRDARPICDICRKVGHVRQHYFHRFQKSPSYNQPQTIQNNRIMPEDAPRIAAYEQGVSSCTQPSNYQNTQIEQVEQVYYARPWRPVLHTPVNSEVPIISTIVGFHCLVRNATVTRC